MDLQETARLGDREQLNRKDRELAKRRRVVVQQRSDDAESNRENESMDSSDEEYYDEEEDARNNRNRTNQPSPTSSSLSNSRRGLRTFRSSPVLRAAADEMFGVPIPRRARSCMCIKNIWCTCVLFYDLFLLLIMLAFSFSLIILVDYVCFLFIFLASTKRLHEYCNLTSGALAEELSHRRFSPSSATVSLIGSGSASPSSSGASMKKKTVALLWGSFNFFFLLLKYILVLD